MTRKYLPASVWPSAIRVPSRPARSSMGLAEHLLDFLLVDVVAVDVRLRGRVVNEVLDLHSLILRPRPEDAKFSERGFEA